MKMFFSDEEVKTVNTLDSSQFLCKWLPASTDMDSLWTKFTLDALLSFQCVPMQTLQLIDNLRPLAPHHDGDSIWSCQGHKITQQTTRYDQRLHGGGLANQTMLPKVNHHKKLLRNVVAWSSRCWKDLQVANYIMLEHIQAAQGCSG